MGLFSNAVKRMERRNREARLQSEIERNKGKDPKRATYTRTSPDGVVVEYDEQTGKVVDIR